MAILCSKWAASLPSFVTVVQPSLRILTQMLPGVTMGSIAIVMPRITEGTYEVRVLKDGWTTVTADGKLAAHYENTVLITDGEPEILTVTEGL